MYCHAGLRFLSLDQVDPGDGRMREQVQQELVRVICDDEEEEDTHVPSIQQRWRRPFSEAKPSSPSRSARQSTHPPSRHQYDILTAVAGYSDGVHGRAVFR